jgi:hypothetical protein
VHLLLAFDLFVVVVAVDSRWLSNSLISEHPILVGAADNGSATPQDYLEKIFQLPFWIQSLPDSARRHLVHGLLERNLLRRSGGTATGAGAPPRYRLAVREAEESVIQVMLRSPGRPHAATRTMAITRDELEFFDQLAPLLGDTPRTVKRLVNVYQLLTAIPGVRRNGQQAPADTFVVALLVAVNGGLPKLAPELFQLARRSTDATTLAELVEDVEVTAASDEKARLRDWLQPRPPWRRLPASRLLTHLDLVERVGFREPPPDR